MANIKIQDVDYPQARQAGDTFTVVVTVDNLSMTAPANFYNPLQKYDGECSNDRGIAGQQVDVTLEVDGRDKDTKTVCVPYLGPLSGAMNKGTDTAAFDVTVNQAGEHTMRVSAIAKGQSGEAYDGPFAINITEDSSAENTGRQPGDRGGNNPYNPGSGGGNGTLNWVRNNPIKAGFVGIGSLLAINTVAGTATEEALQ